tara:strand:+ start:790 stop:1461 length:672 start_codon:yes stop_codon:yes gene_type:complete
MKVKLIVEGGKMQPGPAVSQQLGPMGINLGQVIAKVNEATSGFKGMNVPVVLDVDPKTKEFTVTVSSPSVAELIKKEMGIEKGSSLHNKVKVGNIAFESLLSVAKTKMPDLLCRDLRSSVKTVIGTCVSLGVLIDNKSPQEITADLESGKYDKQIEGEITEVPEEKAKELKEYYSKIKAEQDKAAKVAEEAKAAEEEKKAEETPAATPEAAPAAAAAAPAKKK